MAADLYIRRRMAGITPATTVITATHRAVCNGAPTAITRLRALQTPRLINPHHSL